MSQSNQDNPNLGNLQSVGPNNQSPMTMQSNSSDSSQQNQQQQNTHSGQHKNQLSSTPDVRDVVFREVNEDKCIFF